MTKKTGLVMEGGAMRGLFTTGVIDVFMENGITFDGAIGVSAGAVFGCNLKSKQIARPLRYNKRFCRNWRYCSIRSLILTGDLYGADMCYDRIPYELDPFDLKTFSTNPLEFYLVATDTKTGKPVYHRCTTGDGEDMKWFRASASMPIASRPVKIGKRTYLDGGISDSIPLAYFQKIGYEKNVVILTQPLNYRKQPQKHPRLMAVLLRRYPEVAKALYRRHKDYNRTTAMIRKMEKDGRIFVIRPPEALNIGAVCKDPDELQRVYDIGRKTAEEDLERMKAFMAS